jgi:hypothetical protein
MIRYVKIILIGTPISCPNGKIMDVLSMNRFIGQSNSEGTHNIDFVYDTFTESSIYR